MVVVGGVGGGNGSSSSSSSSKTEKLRKKLDRVPLVVKNAQNSPRVHVGRLRERPSLRTVADDLTCYSTQFSCKCVQRCPMRRDARSLQLRLDFDSILQDSDWR